MRKFVVKATIAAAIVALTAACGSGTGTAPSVGAAGEPATLKVNSFAGGDFASYIIDREGFFEKENLTIEWTDVNTGPQAANALVSGSLDLLYGNLSVTAPLLSQGKKLEVVSGGITPPFSIIGTKDSSVAPWPAPAEGLKGKNIGVPAVGGVAEWYSRYILQQAGVDPNSVTYEGTGGLPQSQAALEQGRVSAIFAGPAQDAVLRAAGHPVIFSWMDSEAYKGTAPESLTSVGSYSDFDYWATSTWVNENPDVVKRFQRAMHTGAEWLKDPANLDAVVASVRKSTYNLPNMDDATFTKYVKTTVDAFDPTYSVAAGNAFAQLLKTAGAPNTDKLPDASEWVNKQLQSGEGE